MIKLGDVCKYIDGSDRPFVVTMIKQQSDGTILIDGIYPDGWTLSDAEVYDGEEWLITKTGVTAYSLLSSLKGMEERVHGHQ